MIKINNLKITYPGKEVLDCLNLSFERKAIVGIIGKNGCGKTSLFNAINGDIDFEGTIKSKSAISYLKQIDSYQVDDYLNYDVHSKYFYQLLSELDIIDQVVFEEEQLKSLSGGEKTKLLLAQLIATNPQVLLLDEPTNHLDAKSKVWLESYLKRFDGLALIISHDREFLNQTVDYIIEIDQGKALKFHGNYDFYLEEKQQFVQNQWTEYHAHKKSEEKIRKEITKYKNWSTKSENQATKSGGMASDAKIKGAKTRQQMRSVKLSKQSKAKVSKLEQHLDKKVEKPFQDKEIKFGLNDTFIKSKELIYIDLISKGFAELLFEGQDLLISATDKIKLSGENGSGKTTLIKIFMGLESYDGVIKLAPHLKIAYLSQDVLDLDRHSTPRLIAKELVKAKQEMFLSNLINMNFAKDNLDKQIDNMSLGERMKIKLAKIVIEDYNLIIFDEPTNHLDIATKEVFEKVINSYVGAMIIVSHDSFITKELTKELSITNKTLKFARL